MKYEKDAIDMSVIARNTLRMMLERELKEPGVILFLPFTNKDGMREAFVYDDGSLCEEDFLTFGMAVDGILKKYKHDIL